VFYNFQIIRPADPGEEINESSSKVYAIVAQFGSLIIPWKYVMVIVPSFAASDNANAEAVSGANRAAKKITNFLYRFPFT